MYKSFYNLSQNPFQLTANLSFFFDSASHKRAKAYLRYGLLQGEGFVVVTGVPGTGKTMLVKNLFQSIQKEEDTNIWFVKFTSYLKKHPELMTGSVSILLQIFK